MDVADSRPHQASQPSPFHQICLKAIEIANEAVAADNAGMYEDAVRLYSKAAEYLLLYVKHAKDSSFRSTVREKCDEYIGRAELLKARARLASGEGSEEEMEADLNQLVGLVGSATLRRVCTQLTRDARRREDVRELGQPALLRHMVLTGDPGVSKGAVCRVLARHCHRLGVASSDTVVECTPMGDLFADRIGKTGANTVQKVREARGGILLIDEACQLFEYWQQQQSTAAERGAEAVDYMMQGINDTSRHSTMLVFAGARRELDAILQHFGGLEARIGHRLHFRDSNENNSDA
jgi:stage V sporulation protein K